MVILQILMIIGIVLACIVGFVLLLVILLLATPFTYRLNAAGSSEKLEEFTAAAKIKWLLGFVTAGADIGDKKLCYYAKVAGIKVFKGDMDLVKEKEEEDEKDGEEPEEQPLKLPSKNEFTRERVSAKIELAGKDTRQIYKDMEADIRREEKELKAKIKEDERLKKAKEKEEKKRIKKENKKPFTERVGDFIEKLHELYEKAVDLHDKILTVKYIIGAPVTHRALAVLKKQLFKILGHIRPRFLKGQLDFAANDPATTAIAYGTSASLAKMIDDRFMIVPDMDAEKSAFKADILTGGHFLAGYIVICALKILFNKDVKRVFKYTKRHLLNS